MPTYQRPGMKSGAGNQEIEKKIYSRKQVDDVYGTQSAPKIKISTVRSIEISQSNHPPPITGRFQLASDRL